jgi:hypothetical protein
MEKIFNWVNERIIGPEGPSKDVLEFVKSAKYHIKNLEKYISEEMSRDDSDEEKIRKANKLIYELSSFIEIYERLYPIINKKID